MSVQLELYPCALLLTLKKSMSVVLEPESVINLSKTLKQPKPSENNAYNHNQHITIQINLLTIKFPTLLLYVKKDPGLAIN